MSEQFFHGLRLLLSAPVLALAIHGGLFMYFSRKAAREAAALHAQTRDRRRHKYKCLRRLLPKERAYAVYAASLAATALMAALEVYFFSLRFFFGLLFFCSALVALRQENRAKQRQKYQEEPPCP